MTKLTRIPIDKIDANPDQPRKKFDPVALQELADSILARGLIQPIVVRKLAKRFEIIAGERRWRAHGLLVKQGHKAFAKIVAIVRDVSAHKRDLDAIIENLQRVDIDPLEEAAAFGRLVDQGMTPDEIAKATGTPLLRVNWRLSLRNLAPDVRKLLATDQIDRQQGNELARLPEHRDQARVLKLISAGKLVGWKPLRNAVDAVLAGTDQPDIFGEAAPKPSKEDVRVVESMERRITEVAEMVGRGWRNGECVIATKVDMNRAGLIADRIDEIQKALGVMSRELRNVTAQGRILLDQPGRKTA